MIIIIIHFLCQECLNMWHLRFPGPLGKKNISLNSGNPCPFSLFAISFIFSCGLSWSHVRTWLLWRQKTNQWQGLMCALSPLWDPPACLLDPLLMWIDEPSLWTPCQTHSFTGSRISYSGVLGPEMGQCPQASCMNRKSWWRWGECVSGRLNPAFLSWPLWPCPLPSPSPSFSLLKTKIFLL